MELVFNSESKVFIRKSQNGTVGIPYDCALEIKLESEVSIQVIETWIDGIEIKGFIDELKNLKTTLKGRALLTSESPGEFQLEIKPIDDLGHFIFTIEIGKQKYIHSCQAWAKVQNSFPLASQELEVVCSKLINYLEAELNA